MTRLGRTGTMFGLYDLPNPIAKLPLPSAIMWIAHILLAYCVVIVISWHVGLGIKKHVFEKSGLMNRMLPFRK